jgi:hypothetical protein
VLSRFRVDFHACLTARADELCELADAVLCADGPVRTLAGLSLVLEHRRGHGAVYDAVNHGRMDIGRLRRALAGLALPRAADGRLVLAADVTNWLLSDLPAVLPGHTREYTTDRPRSHGMQHRLRMQPSCR